MIKNFSSLYLNRKQLLIFFMGISSGVPLYLILSTLFIWLTRENIDISTIGLFALTQIPWTIKFLWAPVVDNYNIPIFGCDIVSVGNIITAAIVDISPVSGCEDI